VPLSLSATPEPTITAKETLRRAVEGLSEAEAAEALELIAHRTERDALDELLDNAPIDDEPESEEGARGGRRGARRDSSR
jgi:hypothetical protein